MKGQHILVTGGSRGIGRAICLAFAQAGADVAVNYAGNEAKAEETAEACRAFGVDAFAVKADVSDSEAVKEMVKTVMDRFGSVEVLVNNAGITRDNLIMRMKEEEFDSVIDTNLKGVFNVSKALTRPMMKQRYGRIINVSSVVGVLGNAGQANYVASKAGVIGFTKSLARELSNRNILVNAVAPGFISTEMTEDLPEDMKTALLNQIPLGKLGNPEDVANVILFLAGDGASYMTGQTLHVDGGMAMP
ncbi:3-oxoacyl-[acyl-carrier-protein] reductase [Salisediminibacterium selenitireducens]|uniref:3-oxoacyl-[acyl-carrier-protein] reductase n=1 Tax=Bacillus selenitireducens (strain ATCC 700615 / DSM 15326 / MLS10) TaxID=439292 RepID=D6XTT2_BACIE|nr:3-oxoacyl-[acyl-carrier-protein] reductase [Salisediminibacterium selenitireducens]ADH99218.1 3-oxoacyl-(acyl-carrier-protein) reductase [[Bacillus] selenitireducens MLS10]